jgi:DNA ligase-1
MLLVEVAEVSAAVAGGAARRGKIEALAACLRRAAPDEVLIVVAWLSGALTQRQIGVGWAALRDVPPPAVQPTLTVMEVDDRLGRIGARAGPGSAGQRRAMLAELFAAATAPEQAFLRRLLSGELRQGALAAVMVEAVARASVDAGRPVTLADLRRAVMLRGELGPVAVAALSEGPAGLAAFRLEVGRPVQPMLAQSAPDLAAALERISPAALEWKLDGVRAQIHRRDRDVAVFTRTLDDITARLPEVVDAALAFDADAFVLDAEVVALRPDGRPRPFQVTAGRVGSRGGTERMRAETPLSVFAFDVLHADGTDVLAEAGADRHAILSRLVPAPARVPRLVTGRGPDAAAGEGGGDPEAFYADAVACGHEGLVVKSLSAPYEAGRRGAGWLKVKPRHTLDLVVLAAEWGHGRRRGYLSNLHLGARDPAGGFVMLGKTFKGLTDEMLRWQTERLTGLAVRPPAESGEWVVQVRPELVVEVAFDGLQASSRYPGGLALRFARVLRHRPDKPPAEADTIEAVRALARLE